MKTYPTWKSIPRDRDGLIPEPIEAYAVNCVNAYPKLIALAQYAVKEHGWVRAKELLKELGELE